MTLAPPKTREDALIALLDEVPPLFFRLRGLTEKAHNARGITAAQRAVLRDLIEKGAMTAPDLAALRSVTRQAVQPVVDELIVQGFAETKSNPRHQRSPLIVATAKGARHFQAMREAEREGLRSAAREFSLSELIAAREIVRHISKVLSQHFPDPES